MTSPWAILGLLAAAHVLAVVTPGPNNAFIMQVASRSRRSALIAATGIWPAGALWAFAGLSGVGAVIDAAPMLALAIRLAGGVYLCWIGWRILSAVWRPRVQRGGAGGLPDKPLALFAMGFMTNFLNPKAIAYYTSIFAATGAYDLTTPWRALAIVGLPGIGFLWYVTFTFMLSSGWAQRGLARAGRWIDGFAGAAMILFGVKLLALP